MADIIAQLQVISRNNGCLLDISSLLDLAICPNVNIQTKRPHKIQQNPDYVTVTPTDYKKGKQQYSTQTKYSKPSYRRGASSYEVPQQVCHKNTVTQDLGLLVPAGLLTKEQLEEYLHKTGALPPKTRIPHNQEVDVDPLLGLDVGKDGSLVDLDVGGKNGLLDAKVGKHGDKSLLSLGLLNKDGLLTLDLNGETVLHLRRDAADEPLAFVQAGGKKIHNGADVDVSALTSKNGNPLAVVQVGGKKINNNGLIQVSALTNGGNRARSDEPLAFVQAGGKKIHNGADVDVSALTSKQGNPLAIVQVGGKKIKNDGLIQLSALTNGGNRVRSDDPLAHVQVGGKKSKHTGAIDLSALTDILGAVADVQVGGEKDDKKNALINLDLLTHEGSKNGNNGHNSGNNGNGNGNNGNNGNNSGNNGNNGHNNGNNGNNNNGNNGNNGHNNGNNGHNNGNDGSNNGNNGHNNGNNGNNGHNNSGNNGHNNGNDGSNNGNNGHNGDGSNNGQNGNNGHNGNGDGYNTYSVRSDYSVNSNNGHKSSHMQHYNTHYQPICNKGLKKEYLDQCEKSQASDVNHCLALCQAHGALLTLDSDVKVADAAHILVCIAIEFNEKAQDGNCRYLVAPETQHCEQSHLEDKDDCYAFIRN